MRGKTLRDLKYLKQNYKPSEIQKLLNSSKLKREVYQELKVSEYVLNNYIKHYKLSNIHKHGQRSLNKNSIGNENPKKVSIDNSIFQEIENPVRRFQEILAKTKETRILLCARYTSPPLRQMRSPLYTNFFVSYCHPPF
jgi:hypothetical protein